MTRALRSLCLLLTCAVAMPAAADPDVFWYNASAANRSIQTCDASSCTPTAFASALDPTPSGDVAVDPVEGMVYWSIYDGSALIQRRSLSGGAIEDLIDYAGVPGLTFVPSIVIDSFARHVYLATPSVATRIRRHSIDAPATPTTIVTFNEAGCVPSCAPQGIALDLENGFIYWADSASASISRKALNLASPLQQVVPGLNGPQALALDLANDRMYFSQSNPVRISWTSISSPGTPVDLVNPVPAPLFGGSLELDPRPGAHGELYIALASIGEIRHCSLDAGCPLPLTLLTNVNLFDTHGLALHLGESELPLLPRDGPLWWALLLALAALVLLRGKPFRETLRRRPD